MDYQVTDESGIDVPELLLQSGLVSSHDLSEAIQMSKRLQNPVSRILLTTGCIDQSVLEMSYDLQLLVREELLTREAAYSSLRRLAAQEITADELLDEIYSSPRFAQNTKAQAEILKRAGIIPPEQLEKALEKSVKTGSSLKSILIRDELLAAGFFPAILRLQEKFRQGRISVEQAAEQLKTEHAFWLKADESQRNAALQAAEALPEQVAPVREGRHQPPVKVAQHQAVKRTATADGDGVAVPAASLVQLLEAAGYLKRRDIQMAYERLLAHPVLSAQLFETLGLVTAADLSVVRDCFALVSKGELGTEQAVQALRLSRSKKIRFKRALEELSGWNAVQARKERRNGMAAGFLVGCLAGAVGVGVWLLASKFGLIPERSSAESDIDVDEIP